MLLFGRRPKLSIGMITGIPASINNQYVPGSGVGASSISIRRSKMRKTDQKYIKPSATISLIATAPTALSGTSSNGQVTISFTTPTSSGGSTITNYKYSTDGGATYSAFSTAVTTSPVTITGLTNGTTYIIKLKAVNSAGDGTASDSVLLTPYSTPSAPTSLSVNVGDTTATLAFTQGSTGGSAITNYQYSTDGGATYTAFSTAVTSSPVTITGLTNGTTYIIKLKAVNLAGEGGASDSVSATPYTTPSAPTSLSATAENGQTTISFTPPTSTGGNTITNYQYSTDGGSTYTAFSSAVTTSPVIITGLTNGTTYTIKIKAVNAAGAGTASGAVTVTPIQYLTAGSLLFNSNNEYLKLTPGIALGSGAYTVECWFYNNNAWSTTSPNYSALMGCVVNSETNGMNLEFTNSKTILIDRNRSGERYTYGFTSDITLNAWHHFVLVRNSSNVETVFIDGIKATSASAGTNIIGGQQTNALDYSGNSDAIGKTYEGQWYGYITNFRAVSGTAVYDPTAASITVPTAVLTSITNTQYLMLGDSATTDAAGVQAVTMNGTVTQTTDYKPF